MAKTSRLHQISLPTCLECWAVNDTVKEGPLPEIMIEPSVLNTRSAKTTLKNQYRSQKLGQKLRTNIPRPIYSIFLHPLIFNSGTRPKSSTMPKENWIMLVLVSEADCPTVITRILNPTLLQNAEDPQQIYNVAVMFLSLLAALQCLVLFMGQAKTVMHKVSVSTQLPTTTVSFHGNQRTV